VEDSVHSIHVSRGLYGQFCVPSVDVEGSPGITEAANQTSALSPM